MTLYPRADQQAAALRQYETCRRVLDEEMGVPPEAETTALFEAIRARQVGPVPRERTAPVEVVPALPQRLRPLRLCRPPCPCPPRP